MLKFYSDPVWVEDELFVNDVVAGFVRRVKLAGCLRWVGYLFGQPVAYGRPLVGAGSDQGDVMALVVAAFKSGGYEP
jgi:hypothetical protein